MSEVAILCRIRDIMIISAFVAYTGYYYIQKWPEEALQQEKKDAINKNWYYPTSPTHWCYLF